MQKVTVSPFMIIMSVSYTHLDVYKRQIIHPKGCLRPAEPNPCREQNNHSLFKSQG